MFSPFETHLQRATYPELRWRVSSYKVTSLEHITERPHNDHVYAHSICWFILKVAQELRSACAKEKDKD